MDGWRESQTSEWKVNICVYITQNYFIVSLYNKQIDLNAHKSAIFVEGVGEANHVGT